MPHYSKYGTEYCKPSTACPCNKPLSRQNGFQPYDANTSPKDEELYPQVICKEVFCPDVCYELPQTTVCCPEKPKKSFWQNWFGDKRCPCSKKCSCKGKKKQKTKTEFICKPCPKELCKTNRPDPCICPRRGCCPTSKAICGCHFFFNVDKYPKRKTARRQVDSTDAGVKHQRMYDNDNLDKQQEYDNLDPSGTNRDQQIISTSHNDKDKSVKSPSPDRKSDSYYEHPSSDEKNTRLSSPHTRLNSVTNNGSERRNLRSSFLRTSPRSSSERRSISSSPGTRPDYQNLNPRNNSDEFMSTGGKVHWSSITDNGQHSQPGTFKKVCTEVRPSENSRRVSWKTDSPDSGRVSFPFPSENRSEGYIYSNSSKNHPHSSDEKSVKNDSIERNHSSNNDIHIGVTLTQEKTRYYRNNKGDCPLGVVEDVSSNECKTLATRKSDESSNDTLTLEIHNNNVKLNRNDTEIKQKEKENLEQYSLQYSKFPRSESYKRELEPLLVKKGQVSLPFNSDREYMNFLQENEKQAKQTITSLETTQDYNDHSTNIDRRVSEILEKLICIEEKINSYEKKRPESKDIRIDIDGQKSTVSFHFSDVGDIKTNQNNDSGDCLNNANNTKGDAVIEIQQKRSRTCSPVWIRPLPGENTSYNLQPLDCGNKNRHKKPKIVIKLPNCDNVNNISSIKRSTKDDSGAARQISWCEVANNLKLTVPLCKCCCYECLQNQNCTQQ